MLPSTEGDITDMRAVYLLQAYDYAPNDPLVCLSLAIASVGRAMQRQSDNRHHLIAQVCPIAGSPSAFLVFIYVAGHGFPNQISRTAWGDGPGLG